MIQIEFTQFSNKQEKVLSWWTDTSPCKDADGIIADGAVRSGKTLCMSLSFVLWAMHKFNNTNFAMCGKSVNSLKRNVIYPLLPILKSRGFTIHEKMTEGLLLISSPNHTNSFYMFGGGDEASREKIQGITLGGVLFDEAALLAESFVNQAAARCSVSGSKFWFNCNPEGPNHWFKKNWIDANKNLIYLHFTMDDNLSLSEDVKNRYKRMYSGIFFNRFILGQWVAADGIIYDMFGEDNLYTESEHIYEKYFVSIDYGTQNPCVFILWGLCNGKWYAIKEYYYCGRESGVQKTDAMYADDLQEFLCDINPVAIIVDPSAASFIAEIKSRGLRVKKARNDVVDGIRLVGTMLSKKEIYFSDTLINTLAEFSMYVWDTSAIDKGEDKPLKENDHAMDAVRYFCSTVAAKPLRENKSR